jgi:dephospho-CoA kinase
MASHPPSPTDRLVIGITGRIGSGKTSAGQYLASGHGFQYIRYSQVLSEWFASDVSRKQSLQEVGWKVMSEGLQVELNSRLIAEIGPSVDVAVDGLRHPIDYESLKNSFLPSFHLLYIDSPANSRWEHLNGRGRYADFASFEKADSHPVEHQINSLRDKADRAIRNEGSLRDLYRVLDEIVLKLKAGAQL